MILVNSQLPRLRAVSAQTDAIAAGPSARLSAWLDPPAAPAGRRALRMALVHPETGERYATEVEIPTDATAKGATLAERRVKTPETATPGTYSICVQAVYPGGGPALPGVSPGAAQPATEVCGGTVVVLPPGS